LDNDPIPPCTIRPITVKLTIRSPLVTCEVIRKERKPSIVEGRMSVIKTVVKGCSDGKAMENRIKKKERAQGFSNESEPENRF